MDIAFEWDPDKSAANVVKHGISFDEAASVLQDPLSTWEADSGVYGREERFIAIGMSQRQRLVLVVFTERSGRFRIISARRPTGHEARAYEG